MEYFPHQRRRRVISFFLVMALMLAFSHTAVHPASASSPDKPIDTVSQAVPLPADQSEEETPLHILLVGQDSREGQTGARADSIILCTFLKERQTIILTSVLRDLYLSIPGHGSNRINAAYAWGGAALLRQTLERHLGIRIDGCLEVDFTQFSTIIDSLGGVSIHLRQDEARHINQKTGSNLAEGLQHMNGDQALAYSRIRTLDSDGDLSRTQRQRNVLSALLESYKNADASTILSLLRNSASMICSDMRTGDLLRYGLELFPMLSGCRFTSQRIPADGDFCYRTIRGMDVITADMDAVRRKFHNTIVP